MKKSLGSTHFFCIDFWLQNQDFSQTQCIIFQYLLVKSNNNSDLFKIFYYLPLLEIKCEDYWNYILKTSRLASLLETPPVLELVRFSKRSDLLPGNKSKNEFNARHAVFVFTFCEKLLRWESSGSQDTRVYSMYVYICIMYFTGCLRWMHRIFRLQDLKGFW